MKTDPKPVSDKPKRRRAKVHVPDPELGVELGGRCRAYSPRGTRCKFCGKVHS